jgi:SAM-dependent methyltransferase
LTIAITFAVEIPSYVFLVPLIALVLIYAPALWTRVPYYPTSREAYPLILAELPLDKTFVFIDIGCGFGDLLFFLAQHRPNGRFIGVEIGFIPMIVGRTKAIFLKRPVRIYFQSMWNVSLAESDFVYTFLSPAPMAKLWDKACREMKSTSTFMSNTFEVPATPDQVARVKDPRGSVLQIFRMAHWTASARDKTTASGF